MFQKDKSKKCIDVINIDKVLRLIYKKILNEFKKKNKI